MVRTPRAQAADARLGKEVGQPKEQQRKLKAQVFTVQIHRIPASDFSVDREIRTGIKRGQRSQPVQTYRAPEFVLVQCRWHNMTRASLHGMHQAVTLGLTNACASSCTPMLQSCYYETLRAAVRLLAR